MAASSSIPDLEQLARDGAIRLEITNGIPTWEAFPGSRHQMIIDEIRSSIKPIDTGDERCRCRHLSDVQIRFKDGSMKRPDVAIFCVPPPRQDEALTQIPEAVIEIISPGYEYKDVVLNPQFYLSQGCGDVVIVDPRSDSVAHYRVTGVTQHHAPIILELQCGCRCTIPADSEDPF